MISINFKYNLCDFLNDVPEVVRAFSPFIECNECAEQELAIAFAEGEGEWIFTIDSTLAEHAELSGTCLDKNNDILGYKRLVKRKIKIFLYNYLKDIIGVSLPYGCLTGVRPTKLYREMLERGEDAEKLFSESFGVSESRTGLVAGIVKTQDSFYDKDGSGVDIFVNIPFCPTRCKYCSFISTEIGRIKKQIPDYIAAVKREIVGICEEIKTSPFKLRAIYVGGGTPTSLTGAELADMLGELSRFGVEFTVEAGRPDSFTEEKLMALKSLNVTRISVNPQTLKDATLVLIGRSHTGKDFFQAYEMGKKYGFDINVDLIAGLPEESFEDFKTSLLGVMSLNPQNITVHTLALKRGSTLTNEGTIKTADGSVKRMVDFARETLMEAGYMPYYMYRQKNMADNLENVGYALPGKECLYNVDYMEETSTILSAGAGAMSKYVFKAQNRLERDCNPKGLNEYLAKRGNK